MQETWARSLGREDSLEKEMATHSSVLAWRIPWMEKPSRLLCMESQRVGHDWATSVSTFLWGKRWWGWWEWLLRGMNFPYGVVKMFNNKIMMIIVQLGKYTKIHWIVYLEWMSFVVYKWCISVCVLSVIHCLFWTFHINRNIPYVIFCDWFFDSIYYFGGSLILRHVAVGHSI